MVRVLDAHLVDFRLSTEQRKNLENEIEVYARDLATRAHVAARDAKDGADISLVADAYRAYLDRFDNPLHVARWG
jgi:hypothetical protein